MGITDEMVKEMCDQFGWNIVIKLKLQKAVKDLKTNNNQFIIEQHQTQILDEVNNKQQTVSKDINVIEQALNDLDRTAKECKKAILINCEQMMSLIEQDRDKLLLQIKTLQNRRKEELEQTQNILHDINDTINATQQQCGQIAINTELAPIERLQNIKNIVDKSKISNIIFKNQSINKTNYKLKTKINLDQFVNVLQETIKLGFCEEDEFELKYNNISQAEQGSNPNSLALSNSNNQNNAFRPSPIQIEYNPKDF